MIKNIAIIGVGGVGGYFGGKLCPDPELIIYFLARGEHLKEINKNGLIVSTAENPEQICRPALAAGNFDDFPMLDFCFICVKSYDLQQVLIKAKKVISDKTIIIPLLNGIDIYERIRDVIPSGIILPACVYMSTFIEKPGKVTQKGGSCKIFFGNDPRYAEFVPNKIFNLFDKNKIKYAWLTNPYFEIWKKFIFIAPFSLVTACYNKTIGQVMQSEEMKIHITSIMKEILSLSIKKGINLPESIIEDSLKAGSSFPFETKTSFQRDFENLSKPDERDLFGGSIFRLEKQYGVDTPLTRYIFNKLQNKKERISSD